MAFATVQELADYRQASVTNSAATLALNIATARIISTTGQMFTYLADDAITLPGGDDTIELPQQPVLSVASVATTGLGETVPIGQVVGTTWIRNNNVLTWLGSTARLNGSPVLPYISYVWPQSVRIVYTHGYVTIPDDVKGCCLMLAAELYTNPDGTQYESIDDYAYRRGDAMVTPAAMALKALKNLYGKSIHSMKAISP